MSYQFPKRSCEHCTRAFRPWRGDQRYCGLWCGRQAKAQEFRDALARGRAQTPKETTHEVPEPRVH